MKKILLLFLMMAASFFAISFMNLYAATFTPEPAANIGGLWHVEENNQAYVYMRYTVGSTVAETGDQQEYYTTWWGGEEHDFSFNTATPKIATLSNPDPLVYDKFNVQIIANINVVSGPSPVVVDILDTDDLVNSIEIRITDWADRPNVNYLYDYSFFDLYVDGIKTLTSRNINADVNAALGYPINPNYSDITFGVKMYWSKTEEVIIDPDIEDAWDELPLTTGNPAAPLGVWGDVEDWDYNALTHKFSFTLNYLETLYYVNDLSISGDDDFIIKTEKILYFTDPVTDDRILYMNFSDELDSMILKTTAVSNVNVWEGEALWNLSQNEVNVTNVLRVYNYIPAIESTGQVYSYFYMPDVDLDELLSVTVNLGYQYHEKEYFWSNYEAGPVQSKIVTLTKGETSSVTPTWVQDVYTTSFWTAGISAALMVLTSPVGVVPYLGWGVAISSFVIGGLFLAADEFEIFAYDVDQIQYVIPDAQLRADIDNFIQSKDPTAEPIDIENNKLYKLNLGVLNDGEYPQILEDLSSVTQIVWQTDGKIYTADGDYINDVWGGAGTLEPEQSLIDQYLIYIVGFCGVVAAGFVFVSLDKSLGAISRIFKDKKKLALLIIITIVILYALGVFSL